VAWTHRRLALLIVALGVAAPVVNSGHVPEALDTVYGVLVGWIGLLVIILCVRRERPGGTLWPLLAASVALGAASTMLPSLVGEGRGSATSDIGDAVLLLSSLLLAVALLRTVVAREPRRLVGLDMLTIVVAVSLVAGVLLIGPAFASSTLALAAQLTVIAHVVIDIVVLSAVIHLLVGPRPLLPATRLVAAAGAAFVTSELLWSWAAITGSYVPGPWADSGWNLQPLLLGLAALHPSMQQLGRRAAAGDDEMRQTTPILLGAAALVGPLLIGAHDLDNHADIVRVLVVWLGGGALSVLVVTRFSLLLRRSQEQQRALDKDLAERGRMLEQFEERYRELMEQIPAVIYDAHVAEDGVLYWQYMSPQCSTILGIDADTLYERTENWWTPVHGEDRECVRAAFARRDGAARPEATEFRFVRPDGEEIWLRDTATVACDGAERHVHGLLFDITTAKHAVSEQERMELELRLAQKLEAVGQLAAGIAHEINTPIQFIGDSVGFLNGAFVDLMALVGVYDELKRSAEHGAPAPELLQRVNEAEIEADMEYLTERVPAAFERTVDGVQRVATIVRAMREFGHPPTADLSPVDLNAVIENTLVVATSEYKYVADVTCELGELPAVICNRGDINQVVLNLIVNAAHAIGDVVGESGERGTITIRTAAQEETVRISIADTGGGIAAEIGGRIYDPFFTTKAVGRGTGQGLAITRTIVERHEGTISFDTIAGEGTTFHITLPTRVASPEPQPQGITA
jgi:PAS domain S-box-containing protein